MAGDAGDGEVQVRSQAGSTGAGKGPRGMAAAAIVMAWRSVKYSLPAALPPVKLHTSSLRLVVVIFFWSHSRPQNHHAPLPVVVARLCPQCSASSCAHFPRRPYSSTRKAAPPHPANVSCRAPLPHIITSADTLYRPLRVKRCLIAHVDKCPRVATGARPGSVVRTYFYVQRLQDALVASTFQAGIPPWNRLDPMSGM